MPTQPLHFQPIQGEAIAALLRANAAALREEFGFVRLAIFGSVARGEATEMSDVNIVVEYPGSATFLQFMALREKLQDLLGRPVDLVTTKALRPELRERIEAEALRVA